MRDLGSRGLAFASVQTASVKFGEDGQDARILAQLRIQPAGKGFSASPGAFTAARRDRRVAILGR
jgi:hypothetical protein